MKNKLPDFFALAFFALWHFVFYLPVTLGAQVFFANDIFRLFYPTRLELQRALAQGRVPLWTPYLQGGFPLFAEGQIGALYPLNLVSVLIFPAHHAVAFTILFHVAWASVGMYALARSIGLNVASATLAGFCFGFGGFFIAHLQHAPHLTVASWLPWLVLCQHRYWRAPFDARWLLFAGAIIGLQFLAGFPPMTLLSLFAFGFFGIAAPMLWGKFSNLPYARASTRWGKFINLPYVRATLTTLAPIVIGAGIGAVQLLPTFELMDYSIRGKEMGFSFFTFLSLDPGALTQFVLPFWYFDSAASDTMEFWAYLGIAPFALSLLAPILRRDARTWFLFAFGLLALALALGRSNPLYEWLYNVPVFNRFRVPARFLFPFTFAFAWLAAFGFQELQNRLRAERSRAAWFVGVIGMIGALGTIWLAANAPFEMWSDVWTWLPFALMLGIGATLIGAWRRALNRRLFATIILALAIFDLALFAVMLQPLNPTVPPTEVTRALRNLQQMRAGRAYSNRIPALSASAVRAALIPNFALQYAKEGIEIYAPLALARNDEYVRAMTPTMRNLLNVRYYILPLETVVAGDAPQFDEMEPHGGLTLELLRQMPGITPTRATQIEIISYTDQTTDLPDEFVAGVVLLQLQNGETISLPIRLGIETADWAMDGLARANHRKPDASLAFPAYLREIGRDFTGRKFVARFQIPASVITAIGARSNLPLAGLMIERVELRDETGKSVALSALLGRNDLALAFRSNVAAQWENRDALPRAFIAPRAEFVPDDQTLARMQRADFDPARLVLLNDAPPINLPGNAAANERVAVIESTAHRVVIQAQTDAPGYLVLTDSWFPGWVAFVNGIETPIQRADYIFRALALAPGAHTIVFEYRPLSFTLGAIISCATLFVVTALAVFWTRRLSGWFIRKTTA
ncbi:MAG: YfhO family protein [Chloroflexi bacterium]|nr:YfhO family protein [Chloroflexota bacterium]